MKDKKELIDKIESLEKEKKVVTLLFSAKDEKHNNAKALCEFLKK